MWRAAALLLVLLCLAQPALAQGTISGVVIGEGSHAVPDATVTLYDEYGSLVPVPENPQQTSSGVGNNAGLYMFYDVPPGTYNVTAEKGGISFFAIANLEQGTATANVVLPGYVETAPAYAEPTPTPLPPRQFISYVPIKVRKAPPAQNPPGIGGLGLGAAGTASALVLMVWRKRAQR